MSVSRFKMIFIFLPYRENYRTQSRFSHEILLFVGGRKGEEGKERGGGRGKCSIFRSFSREKCTVGY